MNHLFTVWSSADVSGLSSPAIGQTNGFFRPLYLLPSKIHIFCRFLMQLSLASFKTRTLLAPSTAGFPPSSMSLS
jgi:hypothetical protein